MMTIRQVKRIFSLIALCILSPCAHAENEVSKAPSTLIQQMVGTWNVQQRMWSGPSAQAINLPAAIAKRNMIIGGFLEEVMELAPGSHEEPFTRIAYFNYNTVNKQYEYFSIDSRLPQMMHENSYKINDEEEITLYGGSFVAPRWGETENVAFRFKLVISSVKNNQQTVDLYLTPLSDRQSAKEFLAFEYIYTRKP
jgi:Protein of unknown function (DUF1579)